VPGVRAGREGEPCHGRYRYTRHESDSTRATARDSKSSIHSVSQSPTADSQGDR
jgi:hypothetical protein